MTNYGTNIKKNYCQHRIGSNFMRSFKLNILLWLIFLLATNSIYSQSFKFTDTTFQQYSFIRIHYRINLDHGSCTTYPCYEYNKELYDSLIYFLKVHPTFKIEIASHIDLNMADSTWNYLMESDYEAVTMKGVLVRFGIDKNRITAKGYGNTKRIIEKDTMCTLNYNKQIDARFTNTRIEISLISL